MDIWNKSITMKTAITMFSDIMDGLDVKQLLDGDIAGNDDARAWLSHCYSYALETRFTFVLKAKLAERERDSLCWRYNLLSSESYIRDKAEDAELDHLRSAIRSTELRTSRDWKSELRRWHRSLLALWSSAPINYGDIPVPCSFGRACKPRRLVESLAEPDIEPVVFGRPSKEMEEGATDEKLASSVRASAAPPGSVGGSGEDEEAWDEEELAVLQIVK